MFLPFYKEDPIAASSEAAMGSSSLLAATRWIFWRQAIIPVRHICSFSA